MQVQRGMVAHSMAGRDKGTVCAVLDYQAPYAWISDGKRRPLERPKKKKLIHLTPTHTVLPEEAFRSNRALRRALAGLSRLEGPMKEEADS